MFDILQNIIPFLQRAYKMNGAVVISKIAHFFSDAPTWKATLEKPLGPIQHGLSWLVPLLFLP